MEEAGWDRTELVETFLLLLVLKTLVPSTRSIAPALFFASKLGKQQQLYPVTQSCFFTIHTANRFAALVPIVIISSVIPPQRTSMNEHAILDLLHIIRTLQTDLKETRAKLDHYRVSQPPGLMLQRLVECLTTEGRRRVRAFCLGDSSALDPVNLNQTLQHQLCKSNPATTMSLSQEQQDVSDARLCLCAHTNFEQRLDEQTKKIENLSARLSRLEALYDLRRTDVGKASSPIYSSWSAPQLDDQSSQASSELNSAGESF